MMDSWKQSLDRYIAANPLNDYDNWCESVIEELPERFFNTNEDWIMDYNGGFDKWAYELYNEGLSVEDAAMIIQYRHFFLYG